MKEIKLKTINDFSYLDDFQVKSLKDNAINWINAFELSKNFFNKDQIDGAVKALRALFSLTKEDLIPKHDCEANKCHD